MRDRIVQFTVMTAISHEVKDPNTSRVLIIRVSVSHNFPPFLSLSPSYSNPRTILNHGNCDPADQRRTSCSVDEHSSVRFAVPSRSPFRQRAQPLYTSFVFCGSDSENSSTVASFSPEVTLSRDRPFSFTCTHSAPCHHPPSIHILRSRLSFRSAVPTLSSVPPCSLSLLRSPAAPHSIPLLDGSENVSKIILLSLLCFLSAADAATGQCSSFRGTPRIDNLVVSNCPRGPLTSLESVYRVYVHGIATRRTKAGAESRFPTAFVLLFLTAR